MENFRNLFQDEIMSFTYSKDWRDESDDSSLKKLIFIENKLQNILTVNRFSNKNKLSMSDFLDKTERDFKKQGWNINNSSVDSISGIDSVSIVTSALDTSDNEFNQYVTFLFCEDLMYVFELTTFPNSKETLEEYKSIINSIIFI